MRRARTDAGRHFSPKRHAYTYWTTDAAFPKNKGWRLDFLLVSPLLLRRLKDFGVDSEYRGREKASDHTPAWITIQP
jgi:exodeoxyribonuclease-3